MPERTRWAMLTIVRQTQTLQTGVLLASLVVSAVFAVPSVVRADGGGFVPRKITTPGNPVPPATPVQHTLSVTLFEIDAEAEDESGPTLTSSPPGISCQTNCEQGFNQGTVVTLTLTGGTATDWTGCDSSSDNQCTVTMDGNKSVEVAITALSQSSQVQGARAERTGQFGLLGGILVLATFLGIRRSKLWPKKA